MLGFQPINSIAPNFSGDMGAVFNRSFIDGQDLLII
jgi:hypothetical protein